MQIQTFTENNIKIANVLCDEIVISDAQSALDLMMSVKYETGARNIAIAKNCVCEEFFILSSGLAGEILQKFINYQFRIAIYGDFSKYTSKPLKDFIYESNNGRNVFFIDSLQQAIEKLAAVK